MAVRSRAWKEGYVSGLPPLQRDILSVVAASGNQGQRVLELAKTLAVRPSTACEAVRTLETKGLIRKTSVAADARGVRVRLSAAGQRLIRQAMDGQDFLADAVTRLAASDQTHLLTTLQTVIRMLRQQGDLPHMKQEDDL